MKKLISALTALAMTAAMVMCCASNDGNSKKPKPEPKEDINLKYVLTPDHDPAYWEAHYAENAVNTGRIVWEFVIDVPTGRQQPRKRARQRSSRTIFKATFASKST